MATDAAGTKQKNLCFNIKLDTLFKKLRASGHSCTHINKSAFATLLNHSTVTFTAAAPSRPRSLVRDMHAVSC